MSKTTDRSARSRFPSLSRWARPLSLVLAGALLGACAVDDTAPVEVRDATSGGLAGIPQQGDVLGAASAPVTLEELVDLRCSHCRAFVDITLPVLVDSYVRAGKLRIVLHNLPILGPASVQAARMAAAMGLQGRQFEFVDAFFHRTPGPISDDVLRLVAGQIPGVDVEAAMEARSSPAVHDDLAYARSLALRFDVEGTPTFLLGKTGSDPHIVETARSGQPETLTGPIDALLAQP